MFTTHPSMQPGAIIGYRKSGAPIRLIAGGSGEGDGDTGTTGQEGGTGGDAGAGTGQQQDPGSGTAGHDGTGTAASTGDAGDGDKTARTIEAIRGDFKTERSRRQALEQQLTDLKTAQAQQAEQEKARNLALAKAFGFAPDEPPDPAKLAADLEAARQQTAAEIAKGQARERELTIELETRRRAARLGADPELLADSRSFMTTVSRLDPASESFGEDLAVAIVQAVTANPSLKIGATTATTAEPPKPPVNQSATTAPPARSGGEHNAAPGGSRQWTREDVVRATPSEVNQAIRDGLLVELGFAPPKSRR
jgi:hypothetical protein